MKRRSNKKSDVVYEEFMDEYDDFNLQKYKRQKNLNRKKEKSYDDNYYDEWN
jgi:hypothetical protein|tara:strand:- start:308 stop:463 length:156 start_codon:yes stop_codon:yes gene_type:complete